MMQLRETDNVWRRKQRKDALTKKTQSYSPISMHTVETRNHWETSVTIWQLWAVQYGDWIVCSALYTEWNFKVTGIQESDAGTEVTTGLHSGPAEGDKDVLVSKYSYISQDKTIWYECFVWEGHHLFTALLFPYLQCSLGFLKCRPGSFKFLLSYGLVSWNAVYNGLGFILHFLDFHLHSLCRLGFDSHLLQHLWMCKYNWSRTTDPKYLPETSKVISNKLQHWTEWTPLSI